MCSFFSNQHNDNKANRTALQLQSLPHLAIHITARRDQIFIPNILDSMPLITHRKFPSASSQDRRPRRSNSADLSYPQTQPRSEPIRIKYDECERRDAHYEEQSISMCEAKYELATWNMYILIQTARQNARIHRIDTSSSSEIDEDNAQSSRSEADLTRHQDEGISRYSDSEDNEDEIACCTSEGQVDDSYDGIFDFDL